MLAKAGQTACSNRLKLLKATNGPMGGYSLDDIG